MTTTTGCGRSVHARIRSTTRTPGNSSNVADAVVRVDERSVDRIPRLVRQVQRVGERHQQRDLDPVQFVERLCPSASHPLVVVDQCDPPQRRRVHPTHHAIRDDPGVPVASSRYRERDGRARSTRAALAAGVLQLTWFDGALHLWAIDPEDGSTMPYVATARLVDDVIGRHLATEAMPSRVVLPIPAATRRAPGRDDAHRARDLGRSAHPTGRRVIVGSTTRRLRSLVRRPRRSRSGHRHGGSGPATSRHRRSSAHRAVGIRSTTARARSLHTSAHLPKPNPTHVASRTWTRCSVASSMRSVEAGCPTRHGDHPRHFAHEEPRIAPRRRRTERSRPARVPCSTAPRTCRRFASFGRTLSAEHDRVSGISVIEPQLRIGLPTTPEEDWEVGLELVDVDRPDRWCTAADAFGATALAVDLAGSSTEVDMTRLRTSVTDAATQLADAMPVLAPLAADPAQLVPLDLAAIEAFLEVAPEALDNLGIRLLGPEQLVRVRAGVRATATPRPAATGDGRFNAGALVHWDTTIDDTPIDEAQLERAAQSGSSLINLNGRWVRLDAGQVRTALDRLTRLRDQTEQVDVAALLKLAAEGARGPGHGTGAPITVTGSGWVADLLAGLPDERLTETSSRRVSPASCATTSAVGWAGCSSSPGSGSAAAWPTTWGSARPPRRWPI